MEEKTLNFIQKAKKIHGDKYNYEKVNYICTKIKVEIICLKHGSFFQLPSNHLCGLGCRKCANEILKKERSYNTDWFIKEGKKRFGDRYDYSLVDYENNYTYVNILCKKHENLMKIKPSNHLSSNNGGCKFCQYENLPQNNLMPLERFIEKAKKIHEDFYDYSKVQYKGSQQNIEIICPKHGSFFQLPSNHLSKRGCPGCKKSKGEFEIQKWLNINNIKYETQKKFENCKGKRHCLSFDFYLPDYNTCIEYDGACHFQEIYGKEKFEIQKKYDEIKNNFCQDMEIRLIRINGRNISVKLKTALFFIFDKT